MSNFVRSYFSASTSLSSSSSSSVGAAANPDDATVGKVAFVITGRTRSALQKLGYSNDAVRNLRPTEALTIVEAAVAPCDAGAYVATLRSEQTLTQLLPPSLVRGDEQQNQSQDQSSATPDHPAVQTNEGFDMDSVSYFTLLKTPFYAPKIIFYWAFQAIKKLRSKLKEGAPLDTSKAIALSEEESPTNEPKAVALYKAGDTEKAS